MYPKEGYIYIYIYIYIYMVPNNGSLESRVDGGSRYQDIRLFILGFSRCCCDRTRLSTFRERSGGLFLRVFQLRNRGECAESKWIQTKGELTRTGIPERSYRAQRTQQLGSWVQGRVDIPYVLGPFGSRTPTTAAAWPCAKARWWSSSA